MRLSRARLWGIGIAAALAGAALVPLIATAGLRSETTSCGSRSPGDRLRIRGGRAVRLVPAAGQPDRPADGGHRVCLVHQHPRAHRCAAAVLDRDPAREPVRRHGGASGARVPERAGSGRGSTAGWSAPVMRSSRSGSFPSCCSPEAMCTDAPRVRDNEFAVASAPDFAETWLDGLAWVGVGFSVRRDRAAGAALAARKSSAAPHRDARVPGRRALELLLGIVLLLSVINVGSMGLHDALFYSALVPFGLVPFLFLPAVEGQGAARQRPRRPDAQARAGRRAGRAACRAGRRARRPVRGARLLAARTPSSTSTPTGAPMTVSRRRGTRRDRGAARRPPHRRDRARPDAARRPGARACRRRRRGARARERAPGGRAARQGRGAARLAQEPRRRRAEASGAASSATCTTAPSSGSCRWR